MTRAKAITYALWYGVVPWPVYEDESHYAPMSYLEHLAMNLRLAARWALWRETPADVDFERTVNG